MNHYYKPFDSTDCFRDLRRINIEKFLFMQKLAMRSWFGQLIRIVTLDSLFEMPDTGTKGFKQFRQLPRAKKKNQN
jgi:hypothetical protein